MVRQEVGQEVTSGIHSSGVNHFILRQILQRSLCQSGGKRSRDRQKNDEQMNGRDSLSEGVKPAAQTAPTTVFSTVTVIAGEKLCLLKFPDGHDWLALYHIQKILIAFIIPMLIVCVNYLMLLRFVKRRSMDSSNSKRRSRVTKSVAIVVLSFFFCWMPNHAITFWGVLVKFNAVDWDKSYYMVHTYVFPVTVCLAHANSCLNPVLYCLMRPEIRKHLSSLIWRISTTSSKKVCATRSLTQGETQELVHLQIMDNEEYTLSIIDRKGVPSSKKMPYTR
ncbi:hypothetical protein FQN60_011235 [Etheostoma spectabile]|uniref:G-protein coupled receptors family 1 profile domain-containing protein n=1 Tax=Etheostoma spectabile TaxID=54343 RepID=A0A5J5DRB0_9PERO|nr:hypothetical protein FQN60_011235 [Etheostoma spectabile]